ncbi:MAG: Fis family transcriptional regulator [Cyanobacteria bacterium P01_D01_bin.1]
MEPLSILASAIGQYVIPKALEKIGEKVGESALAKSNDSIQSVREIVAAKMKATHTETVLTQAQAQPDQENIKALETVLIGQMAMDQDFAQQLQALIDDIGMRSPQLQSVLEDVRIKGSVEIGNVKQVSSGKATQIIGKNLGVAGNFKVGDITQES